ncbi:COR domain-containing protein [Bernardetia sp. Wsw4-3y2]|uniref:COR domain-containing protein n=1 Tax=Bernardetia sp. Wsw4-3y2 TaxID=3127471 RepID=UPI0030CEB0B3
MSELAERLIEENIRTKNPYLDLGNCGLDGTEDELYRKLIFAKHIKILTFSHERMRYDFTKSDWIYYESSNQFELNQLQVIPKYLPPNLEELTLAGIFLSKQQQKGVPISNIENLKKLNKLRVLDIHQNKIKDISTLEYLLNIEELYIGDNYIQDIKSLQNLKKLKVLDMASAGYINSFSPLENLEELCVLDASLLDVQDLFPLSNLKKLEELYLSENEIQNISPLKNLTKLKTLDLNYNNIKKLGCIKGMINLKTLLLEGNEISIIKDIKYLNQISHLSLSYNKIKNITDIQNLLELKVLKLRENKIIEASKLQNLKNLEFIDLSHNYIKDISFINNLLKIRKIDVSCNKINSISFTNISHIKSDASLEIRGNPIMNIPKNILDDYGNVLEAVKNHLKSIQKEEDRKELNEAKLIFVGVGELGKTELSEALSEAEYKFEGGRKFTKGIRIKPWQLVDCKREEQKTDFIAHIWDFAGQEINYGTHQFFLTKNSIYVFVWETRKGEDKSKFAYWLRIVSLLSKNAPVLIVQNKIDEIESEVNQKQWKEQFPNIVDFYKTSCKEGTGIDALRTEIQNQLLELPHTREIWNKYRVAVRDELIESSKNIDYISYKDYLKVCEKHTVSKEDASFLSDQLHNIGSVLHFSEEARLKNTVVLNSEWITDAAYLLLDTKKVERGRFHFSDLDKIWEDERFDEKHEFLINLIEKFELIFQFQDSDLYIVPEGLPVEEPTGVAEIKPTFESKKTKYLRFEYHYPFMPKGILSRFICRLHENIFEEYFWKNGVVLVLEAKEKETFAKVILNEVENPKTIKIEVWGKQADKLLAIIRRNIDHIHSKFEELEIFQKIPCVCVDCKGSLKPYLHDYNTLKRFQEKGKTTRECAIGAEDVEIATLLEGILDTKTIRGNRLIELIERNNVSDFFAELDRMGIRGNQIARLKAEFISGTNDFQFPNRLITLVSKF